MNVVAISSTLNTAPIGAENPAPGCDPSLSFLTGAEKVYAANLIGDWQRQLQQLDGALPKTCKGHKDDVFRLLNHAKVPPWELKKDHVGKYLDSRCDPATKT